MSAAGEPLLSVRALCVDYGDGALATRALDGIDFEVARGESLAIAGESGSGKSTLALALLGLLPAAASVRSGALRFMGRELSGARPSAWSELRGVQLGFVPQDGNAAFDPLLPIGAQIEQLLVQRGMPRARARLRTLELLGEVGLEQAEDLAREIPARLSGGQRQRASIAAAIALDPALLVADEPTSALDPVHARALIEGLDGLRRKRGLALVWISHDLRAIEARADRVMLLYAGRTVEAGSAREVLRAPRHPYTRLLLRSLPDPARRGGRLAAMPAADARTAARNAACCFHARCPLADERCRNVEPALERDERGHALACHYPEKAVEL